MSDYKSKMEQNAKELAEYAKDAPYLSKAFYHVYGKKLLTEGYVDCSNLLKATAKGTWFSQLKGSRLQKLYSKGCIPSENLEIMLEYLEEIVGKVTQELTPLEEQALVFWIFLPYHNVLKRDKKQYYLLYLMEELVNRWSKELYKGSGKDIRLTVSYGIVYDTDACQLRNVESVSTYVRDISQIKADCKEQMLYYRGHSRLEYELLPGIKRNQGWLKSESKMYQELRVRCAQNFVQCDSHLDYLVEMQHYGLPTRLLDITENPMVALYFACCSNEEETGEVIILQTENSDVKYAKSDTAAILAALPVFSYEMQNRLYELCVNGDREDEDPVYQKLAGKLAAEIKSRNPAFEPRIRKQDLLKNVFVTPLRNNPRIIKQDGSFILCGLGDGSGADNSLRDLRYRDENGKKMIFIVCNKAEILKELDLFSINRASLFPEIDDVAEYIKTKYNTGS